MGSLLQSEGLFIPKNLLRPSFAQASPKHTFRSRQGLLGLIPMSKDLLCTRFMVHQHSRPIPAFKKVCGLRVTWMVYLRHESFLLRFLGEEKRHPLREREGEWKPLSSILIEMLLWAGGSKDLLKLKRQHLALPPEVGGQFILAFKCPENNGCSHRAGTRYRISTSILGSTFDFLICPLVL